MMFNYYKKLFFIDSIVGFGTQAGNNKKAQNLGYLKKRTSNRLNDEDNRYPKHWRFG